MFVLNCFCKECVSIFRIISKRKSVLISPVGSLAAQWTNIPHTAYLAEGALTTDKAPCEKVLHKQPCKPCFHNVVLNSTSGW